MLPLSHFNVSLYLESITCNMSFDECIFYFLGRLINMSSQKLPPGKRTLPSVPGIDTNHNKTAKGAGTPNASTTSSKAAPARQLFNSDGKPNNKQKSDVTKPTISSQTKASPLMARKKLPINNKAFKKPLSNTATPSPRGTVSVQSSKVAAAKGSTGKVVSTKAITPRVKPLQGNVKHVPMATVEPMQKTEKEVIISDPSFGHGTPESRQLCEVVMLSDNAVSVNRCPMSNSINSGNEEKDVKDEKFVDIVDTSVVLPPPEGKSASPPPTPISVGLYMVATPELSTPVLSTTIKAESEQTTESAAKFKEESQTDSSIENSLVRSPRKLPPTPKSVQIDVEVAGEEGNSDEDDFDEEIRSVTPSPTPVDDFQRRASALFRTGDKDPQSDYSDSSVIVAVRVRPFSLR